MIHSEINNDVQLVTAFKNGDPASLEVLWKNNYKALVYFADQLVRNNLLSEDIVSETFVKLWKLRANFDNVYSIRSFLYVTVKNNCYDHLRSQEIHTRIHKEILYTSDYVSEMNRDDYDMMYAEYIQQLYVQVRELPDRCREVFKLFFFERMATREIALALGISEQTVRNQKSKAVQVLKAALLKKNILPAVMLFHFLGLLNSTED
jgi:RNA polymerase sigma-70 factor (family 1)